MQSLKGIEQFIELTIEKVDKRDSEEEDVYGGMLALITTLCTLALERFRRKIHLHRRVLNNLILYYHQKYSNIQKTQLKPKRLKGDDRNGNVGNLLVNEDWVRKNLRVSRDIFCKLYELIKEQNISKQDLIVFLIWLASGCSYEQAQKYCCQNTEPANELIEKTMNAILKLSSDLIKPPSDEIILQNMGISFAAIAGHTAFANVVGVIDCWKISIRKNIQCNELYSPISSNNIIDAESGEIFLQTVCDHRGLILDKFVGLNENSSNSRILRSSAIYQEKTYPPCVSSQDHPLSDYFIVGKRSLPCISRPISILTPYPLPMNSPKEAQFNSFHSRLMKISEKTFYKIYRRWVELFSYPLNLSEIEASRVVEACAIIHNACILFNNEDEVTSSKNEVLNLSAEPDQLAAEYEENEVDSEDVRDALSNQLPSPIIIPLCFKKNKMI